MRESRPALLALFTGVAVLLFAGAAVFTVPVAPCPACTPLEADILGANPKGEVLRFDCPNCGDRRRVSAVSGWSKSYYSLGNPWLSHLYYGERSSAWTRPFKIGEHTPAEDRLALPVLIRAIHAHQEDVSFRAGLLLGEMGPGAAPAAPDLMAALKDRTRPRRGSFAEAVGRIGVDPASGIPLLMQFLREPEGREPGLHASAAAGLHGYGARAKPAIPLLIGLLKSPNDVTRASAARALGVLGPESSVAIPELADLSKGRDFAAEVARAALEILGAK